MPVAFKAKTRPFVASKVFVPKLMRDPAKRRKPASDPLAKLKLKLKLSLLVYENNESWAKVNGTWLKES